MLGALSTALGHMRELHPRPHILGNGEIRTNFADILPPPHQLDKGPTIMNHWTILDLPIHGLCMSLYIFGTPISASSGLNFQQRSPPLSAPKRTSAEGCGRAPPFSLDQQATCTTRRMTCDSLALTKSTEHPQTKRKAGSLLTKKMASVWCKFVSACFSRLQSGKKETI